MQAYETQLPEDLRDQRHDCERDPFAIIGPGEDTVHESASIEPIREHLAIADEKARAKERHERLRRSAEGERTGVDAPVWADRAGQASLGRRHAGRGMGRDVAQVTIP